MPILSTTVTITTHRLKCNKCGVCPLDLFGRSSENAFPSKAAAIEAARIDGWEINGEVLTCPVCIICRDTKTTWRFAGPGDERKDAK